MLAGVANIKRNKRRLRIKGGTGTDIMERAGIIRINKMIP